MFDLRVFKEGCLREEVDIATEELKSPWQHCYNVSAATNIKFGTNIQNFDNVSNEY